MRLANCLRSHLDTPLVRAATFAVNFSLMARATACARTPGHHDGEARVELADAVIEHRAKRHAPDGVVC